MGLNPSGKINAFEIQFLKCKIFDTTYFGFYPDFEPLYDFGVIQYIVSK